MNITMTREGAENILAQSPSAAAIAGRFDSPSDHWVHAIRIAIASAYLAGQVDRGVELQKGEEEAGQPEPKIAPALCGKFGCLRKALHKGGCTTDPAASMKWDLDDIAVYPEPRRRVGRERIGEWETLGAPAQPVEHVVEIIAPRERPHCPKCMAGVDGFDTIEQQQAWFAPGGGHNCPVRDVCPKCGSPTSCPCGVGIGT